ncbi:peptidyl-prolyl cis-trans isomerase SurA [Winogradskyella wandonensis]|uniref:Peptidyl-prolyl cis-trans isomerase SurA n=1 Tax=Winogradskyella wandonensis TaxID=1442586 RepID=A0A4R1KQ71_9FLAO|nr:peptidylprolyl isomerase [Winogradskyella wandonensis]TCK66633.1 peptidyl-prolyl cis-trans isomerase SurA [Winogradskyella wandonensis]
MTNRFNSLYLKNKLFLVVLFVVNTALAQTQETLLTVEGQEVSSDEFLKLYKKNLDLVKDESQKELDNYLELFINYKLKLKEAERLGLDKDVNYQREFENYKKQLTKNYLTDNQVTDALVKEAYDRMRYDIKASHILIMDNPEEEDTLVAYNKLLDFRKVLKDEGFKAAKEKFHNGKTILVEDLGYFSAFKMVYDFESKAYKTQPGEVSMPFKTQFGYHIVRVDDKRPSRGQVTVAHIMVSLKQKDSTINPEERVNTIYNKLQQGEAFDALAKQFSDDKSSARNGGKLRAFKSGQLSSVEFEDAAFAIKNIGDITKPIKTQYGWHIIKLLNKEPIQDFEDIKPNLEAQVKRDQRSKLINSAMAKKLSKKYTVVKNEETKAYFKPILEDAYFSGKFNLPSDYNGNTAVIKINDSIYSNNDFLQFLKSKQRQYMRQQTTVKKVLDAELPLFYEQSILKFREDNLVNENKEFADILKEYKDGLLLFSLMEKEIWNKAAKDSTGLRAYYEANKNSYQWEDRIEATIATGSKKANAELVKKLWNDGKTDEEIKKELNTGKSNTIIFTQGTFEKSNQKLPSNLKFSEGISDVYFNNENYHVINISKVLKTGPKSLDEARGSVVNDYQAFIEAQWLENLREKYKVSVNQKVLKLLKAKFKN